MIYVSHVNKQKEFLQFVSSCTSFIKPSFFRIVLHTQGRVLLRIYQEHFGLIFGKYQNSTHFFCKNGDFFIQAQGQIFWPKVLIFPLQKPSYANFFPAFQHKHHLNSSRNIGFNFLYNIGPKSFKWHRAQEIFQCVP